MADGELKKQLDPMFAGYFDDYYTYDDILKVLDKAKKEIIDGKFLDTLDKYSEVNTFNVEEICIIIDWFKKWFGSE